MAKIAHGQYGAFTSNKGIRFTKDKKMTSRDSIPPEVVVLLESRLKDAPTEATRPVLTDEQKAELRAASLQVKPELQASPEKLAEDAEALTEEDFQVEETMEESTEPSATQMQEVSQVLAPAPQPPVDNMHVAPGAEQFPEDNFLETVSIHTAPLEDIVRALYERFGIYSVYLRQLPNPDEINPLTGEPFTKYHQGIAYQAAIGAQNRGILDRPAEEGRRLMDEGRNASANFRVDEAPRTMADARRADSFDYRTSVRGNESTAASEIVHVKDENGVVHAVQRELPKGQTGEFNGAGSKYDADEDEVLVVPQMGKQVIRPNW